MANLQATEIDTLSYKTRNLEFRYKRGLQPTWARPLALDTVDRVHVQHSSKKEKKKKEKLIAKYCLHALQKKFSFHKK